MRAGRYGQLAVDACERRLVMTSIGTMNSEPHQPPKVPPRDPRAVANLLLDIAADDQIAVGHVKLQKLLYFAHGFYLNRFGQPLVSGHFEAWKHGPVHPAVYRAFSDAGCKAITFRAMKEDILAGTTELVAPAGDRDCIRAVTQVVRNMGAMNDWALVELSHAPGGPWAEVVEKMAAGLAFGARIEHDVIRSLFSRHRLVVRPEMGDGIDRAGDRRREARRDVETPFSAANRVGQLSRPPR